MRRYQKHKVCEIVFNTPGVIKIWALYTIGFKWRVGAIHVQMDPVPK